MYRTLTDGFGMMAAQTWMVPQQKYDVIHYIREAYLKPGNSSQYIRVDDFYRAQLPKGTSRGPAPVEIEPWTAMDYGTSLSATFEVGGDSPNFAFKGIAIRLDPGQGGCHGDEPGSSTTMTRSAWRLPGPARDSSTGTESTSTVATKFTLGSSAASTSPTPISPGGQTRTTEASPISATEGGTDAFMALCRTAGHITRGFIATATR